MSIVSVLFLEVAPPSAVVVDFVPGWAFDTVMEMWDLWLCSSVVPRFLCLWNYSVSSSLLKSFAS